jgi:hypothetical protein
MLCGIRPKGRLNFLFRLIAAVYERPLSSTSVSYGVCFTPVPATRARVRVRLATELGAQRTCVAVFAEFPSTGPTGVLCPMRRQPRRSCHRLSATAHLALGTLPNHFLALAGQANTAGLSPTGAFETVEIPIRYPLRVLPHGILRTGFQSSADLLRPCRSSRAR